MITILPTIHINGTSPEMLREGYLAAYRATQDAIDALEKVEFNGRDYYPQGNHAFLTAQNERRGQFKRLRDISAELMEVLEHVQESIDDRRRQQERPIQTTETEAAGAGSV